MGVELLNTERYPIDDLDSELEVPRVDGHQL